MTRRNRTPEENERRKRIRELLQIADIGSMQDIQELFKETIAEFMENGLEAELDEELGYSKYDYKNKNTDNSRNGHSSKTLRTSCGSVEVSAPRDRKGEFEPQILKKNQTSISQDIEEKIISMYAKGMSTDDISDHVQNIYGIRDLFAVCQVMMPHLYIRRTSPQTSPPPLGSRRSADEDMSLRCCLWHSRRSSFRRCGFW